MLRIIETDLKYKQRILPYIGGREVNDNSTHLHHRFVICLSDLEKESQLEDWIELKKIVQEKVKPERDLLGNNPNNIPLKRCWWAYQAHRPDFYKRIKTLDRILVCSSVSKYLSFAWFSSERIFSHNLTIIALSTDQAFAILQSRTHELFATFFSSTLEDRQGYRPSDCFETFPFPTNWENNPQLEDIGKKYYEYRAQLMIANNQGLTATYNRFHDPDEYDQDILKLRDLHNQMDRAVLDAYGWTDLQPTCEFLLDYEDEEETDPFDSAGDASKKRAKKKPYRYRWADEIRDEVLARLLALNEERYVEEVLRGDKKEGKSKKAKGKTSSSPSIPNFFNK